MSSVADILQSLAENAGQAQLRKGAIYGNLVANAAQVPAVISADRERDAALRLHTSQVQQQMELERSRAAREDQLARHQDTADAQALQTQQHLGTIISAGFQADPTKFDIGSAVKTAQSLGRPDLIPTVAAVHDKFTPKPILKKDDEAGFDPATNKPIPGMESTPKQTPEQRQIFLLSKKNTGVPLTAAEQAEVKAFEDVKAPKTIESKAVLLDGKPAIVNYSNGKHTLPDGTDVSDRVKPMPPASTVIDQRQMPSADAIDMAAKRYLATGELPSMGRGATGNLARTAVMNRAAILDPTAALAANKAVYKADSTNLTNLQKTEGTLSAFEKTAGKNLDQFLALADKIPDTGVPWLNQPIRSVNDKLLGSADQAAFNAARDVALREIARVTNDPKLSGVLTDSARKEVSGLAASSATFAQIKAVAKVLKQDMANVHAGINDQIDTVKAGLQGHPGATPAAAPAGTGATYKLVNGEWVKQ